MEKEEVLKWLKDNLEIQLDVVSESFSGSYLKIKLVIGNETISEDSVSTNRLFEP